MTEQNQGHKCLFQLDMIYEVGASDSCRSWAPFTMAMLALLRPLSVSAVGLIGSGVRTLFYTDLDFCPL